MEAKVEAQMQAGAPSRADGTVTSPTPAKQGGSGWTRAAALTGVVFALALVFNVVGNNDPSATSSAAKVAHFYVVHKDQMNRRGLFGAIAVMFGLGFFSYLRAYLRRISNSEALTGLYFTGVLFFAIGGALDSGLHLMLGDSPKSLSPDSLQALNMLSQDLTWPMLSIGLTLMYLGIAIIILRTRALPVWLGWLALVLTVVSASLFFSFIGLLAALLGALVLGIVMAVRNPEVGAERSTA